MNEPFVDGAADCPETIEGIVELEGEPRNNGVSSVLLLDVVLVVRNVSAWVVVGDAVALICADDRSKTIYRLEERCLTCFVLANKTRDVADIEVGGVADALEVRDVYFGQLQLTTLLDPGILALHCASMARRSTADPPFL